LIYVSHAFFLEFTVDVNKCYILVDTIIIYFWLCRSRLFLDSCKLKFSWLMLM